MCFRFRFGVEAGDPGEAGQEAADRGTARGPPARACVEVSIVHEGLQDHVQAMRLLLIPGMGWVKHSGKKMRISTNASGRGVRHHGIREVIASLTERMPIVDRMDAQLAGRRTALVTRRMALGLATAIVSALGAGSTHGEAKKKRKKKKPTPPPTCTQTACFVRRWGTEGAGNGQFAFTSGIAAAPNSDVYVTDESTSRVQVFNASGVFLRAWGNSGGPNALNSPRGIAIAPNGNVYVADTGNDRVQWFTPTGAYLGQINSASIPPGTVPENELNNPISVAVGPSGNVYVTSFAYNRIFRFSATGGFLGWWGRDGTGQGEFDSLERIAVGINGDVYATDEQLARVQRFNATGAFLGVWGGAGSGDGQFSRVWGLSADANGNIYVADVNTNRIQQFSPSGGFLGKWGTLGSSPGEFVNPTDVAVGPGGNIYVADAGNHRIQQFALPAPPAPPRKKKKKKKKR